MILWRVGVRDWARAEIGRRKTRWARAVPRGTRMVSYGLLSSYEGRTGLLPPGP